MDHPAICDLGVGCNYEYQRGERDASGQVSFGVTGIGREQRGKAASEKRQRDQDNEERSRRDRHSITGHIGKSYCCMDQLERARASPKCTPLDPTAQEADRHLTSQVPVANADNDHRGLTVVMRRSAVFSVPALSQSRQPAAIAEKNPTD